LGPIFVREWLTVPRRTRHYAVRTAYLGFLWVLGLTIWQVFVGWSQATSLADNARFGLRLFQLIAEVQLAFILFFAALSAASAITQEKDRRTFILLLMTDLRSYEIVLGKLLGSLLQIALLIVGMVPILFLVVFLGGVGGGQVIQATLVLAATALAAGSVGCLVALWREKTFQALALTVLFIVFYWCLVRGFGSLPFPWASSLQVWLDPLSALQSVLEPQAASQTLWVPAYGFALVMLLISVALMAWGIARLRVWNPSGEPIMQREIPEDEEDKDRAKAHAAPGKARELWANPILWREMRTLAYGRMPLLVKCAYFLVLGLVCYYAIAPLWGSEGAGQFAAAWGLLPVSILSLLLVGAQAVTAITSERDIRALDLLLVTDLSPKEFIFGKLWGILYNTKEYLLPPLILAVIYAWFGFLATPRNFYQGLYLEQQARTSLTQPDKPTWLSFGEVRRQAVLSRGIGTGIDQNNEMSAADIRQDWLFKNLEAFIFLAIGTVIILAFAIVLGVHVALRNENTRVAIINALATIFFLSGGTMVCIYLILINGRFEYQWTSFILFIAAGIGGLWWVLSGDRPSTALTVASWCCPLAMFYAVTNILIAKPGSEESTDPLMPFLVATGAFGFALAAMLVPLLSEFDVALGRTTGGGE
jgi:ABC-type Na+ efflux pump permease subunit